ncbi:MAG: helix-turn-helix transcriptional regulator [Chloroflexi bacterium]|nr:MAG: helix-turn-helix transcriptional regulator [Chloroflexota bacterium]
MQRGPRGSGVAVDPERVREARIQAGLSLAQVAGDDVSRTFIHFVERGTSRPSRKVLALIARRTGRPITYFMAENSQNSHPSSDLAAELSRIAKLTRRYVALSRLNSADRETLKLVELALRMSASLTKSLQSKSKGESKGT